jgi:8-oxo-dGTP pyrophosphatase MutT (NUDIX family)
MALVTDPSSDVTERTAARVLVVDDEDAVLLLQGCDPARPDRGSWWFTPGGGLDPGERAQDGARRELKEETGLEAGELGPVVFRRTVEFDFENVRYRQRESFFCIRSSRFTIDDAGWSDVEVRSVLGHRWWSLPELRETGDTIHPPELVQIVTAVLDARAAGQD